MNRTEEEIINSFKDALANGDVQTLQYMLSFAGNYHQMAMNIRHYEQYLSCGYTGKPSFDKYGWIENGKELKENILGFLGREKQGLLIVPVESDYVLSIVGAENLTIIKKQKSFYHLLM